MFKKSADISSGLQVYMYKKPGSYEPGLYIDYILSLVS